MTPESLHCFGSWVKTALSPATLQSYLARRAAQGVGGAKALAQSSAIRGATGSRQAVQGLSGLEKFRLHGVQQGGLAARRVEQAAANPVTQGMRSRVGTAYESAVQAKPGVYNPRVPLSQHYDYGATAMAAQHGGLHRPLGYSSSHVDSMMGGSRLHDPKKLIQATPPKPVEAGTVASGPRRRPVQQVSGVAPTQVSVNPLGHTQLSVPRAA